MSMLQVVEIEYLPDVALVCEMEAQEVAGYLVAVMTARAQEVFFGTISGCPELRFLPMGDYSQFVTVCDERGFDLAIV